MGTQSSTARKILLRVRNHVHSTAVAQAAHVWFVNPQDATRLAFEHKTLLHNVVQIPDECHSATPVRGRILMVGWLAYQPNAEGLEWFVRCILPELIECMPELEFHVVGRPGWQTTNFGSEYVKLRGFVPDLQAEYAHASLVVAPIHSGGGTQIKVIEALANGRPLVASDFAYRGFADDFRPGEHLLVAENLREWVAHCRWALTHSAAAEEMAARARTALRPYSPANLTEIVTRTLVDVAKANSA